MLISDLTVEVRDEAYNRLGFFQPEDLVGFTMVARYRAVGTWKIVLPVGHDLGSTLATPGAGIIVTYLGEVIFSGPTTAVTTNQSTDDPNGTLTIEGVDDTIILRERLAYPTPTTANVAAQTSAYDTRTGKTEDVVKAYVSANIGPNAPAERKISNLTIQTSQSRGVDTTYSARFETLQEILVGLTEIADLGFTIEQVGTNLEFQVFTPTDRSSTVRLDIDNGHLSKSEYAYSNPLVTRTIVGGSGDGTARVFVERSNANSLTAEADWNRRIETFTDARSESDLAKLQQAGDETLSSDGKTIVSVSISPSDDQTMRYGIDWNLGDRVTCVIGDTQLTSIVTEIGIIVSSDGVRLGATVGEPRSLDYETQILTRQADQALRISQLERTK